METKVIDDGGPAFPRALQYDAAGRVSVYAESGMSLRAYFVAHAPADPQEWFEPVGVFAPAMVIGADGKEYTYQEMMDNNIVPHEEWRKACDAGRLEYRKQRYIQWPVAYADALLATLAKGGA